jgi:transcriptional regulator with XRE-family HTH domain
MENLESRIGEKAKNLRKSNNITLKELSEKTNLSVGYLSQFERGINTIAIDSLSKIADVFNVELSYFFPNSTMNENMSQVVKSYEQRVLDVIGDGYIIKLLSNNARNHSIYPRMIEILPRAFSEKTEAYGHSGEEFIYVLEGILTLILNNTRQYLYPGDSAHYMSTDEHNWTNETNKIVKILCVSTPNPFSSDR